MATTLYTKDPSSLLDYALDWSDWLETDETIDSAVWTVPTGLRKNSSSINDALTIVWLSEGTVNTSYHVTCCVTTSLGRIDERSFNLNVTNR